MHDEDFRYWSSRSTAETVAAIGAGCSRSAAAHHGVAILCMRRALAVMDCTMLANDVHGGLG